MVIFYGMRYIPSQINLKSLLQNNVLQNLGFKKAPEFFASYGAIDILESKLLITHTKHGKVTSRIVEINSGDITENVKKEIRKILSQHSHKLIATSFSEKTAFEKLAARLWLEEDIVSFIVKDTDHNGSINVEERLKLVSSNFDQHNIANIRLTPENEVIVTDLVTFNDYKLVTSQKDINLLLALVKKCKGKKISFINATPQGGGVAIMRHALIRLFKLLGIDVHWYVVTPDEEVFTITKRKFHNILQAVYDPRVMLTEQEKKQYNRWIKQNTLIFRNVFETSDIIVIDDPQPSGLIPYIKEINPKVKIIYRSHIQIEAALANKKGTPQQKTWQFLWENIKRADCFVSHPIKQFIPKEVVKTNIAFMPATTDPLDGLNKPLTEEHMHYYLKLFNKFLQEEEQFPLDFIRPYIIQIARFDPSKGIPDVLASYLALSKLCKEKGYAVPQLVITGNGSIDDPDRAPIYAMAMDILHTQEYVDIKKDVKVARLPHIDQLLNTLLRKSKMALQLSTKEGFEIKVTEALMKGKPVIAYRTGGIPLQIKDGVNGFLVKPGNTDQVAKHIFDLLTDEKLYNQMSKAAEKHYDHSLLTIPNAIRWLELGTNLLKSSNK